MGIVINACRDHGRRRGTWTRAKDGLLVLAGLARGPDGRDLYRQTWLASELARLDPLLRETVVFVVGEDMTHAEAARALGVAEVDRILATARGETAIECGSGMMRVTGIDPLAPVSRRSAIGSDRRLQGMRATGRPMVGKPFSSADDQRGPDGLRA